MMVPGRSPLVNRAFAQDLADQVDLGELLAVRAFRVDEDIPAVRRDGNRRVRGEVAGQRAEASDHRGALGGISHEDAGIIRRLGRSPPLCLLPGQARYGGWLIRMHWSFPSCLRPRAQLPCGASPISARPM